MPEDQGELFHAETSWFHVFNAMVQSGDVARMGPHAVAVYLVIKAHTNFSTGRAFPAIDTIVEKSGVSRAQVMRSLITLEQHEYIVKEREGRHNVYRLREKVEIKDGDGRPTAVATWDYLPTTVREAQAELKKFILTGTADGKIVYIEQLNLNVQINHAGAKGTIINQTDRDRVVDTE